MKVNLKMKVSCAEKDKVLEEMDHNIAELKNLSIKKNIKDATEKESVKGIESLDKIADEQNQLRKDTEKLQDLLSKEMKIVIAIKMKKVSHLI